MDANLTAIEATNPALATAQIIDSWLDYERREGASARTLDTYRQGLAVFVSWLQANGRPEATPELIARFRHDLASMPTAQDPGRTYSVQTVNVRLAAVRSFFRYLVATGRLANNPASEVRGLKRAKSRQHKRDALTNGEVRCVLETCQPATLEGTRDRAILVLMAYCGLRSIEIHRANMVDLRTRGERLVLRVQGKGRAEADELAVIPYAQEDAIRAWLRQRLAFADCSAGAPLFVSLSNRSRGARLSLRAIRDLVKARYAAANVVGSDKTTHSLRHSAISNAIRRGASVLQVQALARHADFNTTLAYVHEIGRLDAPAEDLIDYGA